MFTAVNPSVMAILNLDKGTVAYLNEDIRFLLICRSGTGEVGSPIPSPLCPVVYACQLILVTLCSAV